MRPACLKATGQLKVNTREEGIAEETEVAGVEGGFAEEKQVHPKD